MTRPKFIAFSPVTQLSALIAIDAVTCAPTNLDAFPDVAAGEFGYITFMSSRRAVSEDPDDYETGTYTGKGVGTLTGLTRGVEGLAQAWPADTYCFSGKTMDSDEKVWDKLDGTTPMGPTLENYAETRWIQNHTVAGNLTLDLEAGNVHVVNFSANIDKVIISNAPVNAASSITLKFVRTAAATLAWLDKTIVIDDSIGVAVDDTDDSYNSAAAFADNLQAGDLVAVTGFTTAANNGTKRIMSATTSKIKVDDTDLVTEAAGDTINIDRFDLYPESLPEVPALYTPVYYILWTVDGTRWNISEVGEF